MSLISKIQQRLRRDYYRWLHQKASRGILDTPPLKPGAMPFTLLSMVQKRDVLAYLVALKSFAAFACPQRVVVVCDPSLDAADRSMLQSHVPHIELRAADEFTHPDIPRGGTWERLLAICDYARDAYVVQLDADTVTVDRPHEVLQAISRRVGFVLGEAPKQTLITLETTSANAQADPYGQQHIQGYSEACMSQVGLPANALYVRGCSGFTGFPPSASMREDLVHFSNCMARKIGLQRWSAWGTEQITSNYLVANAAGTQVLPFPEYGTPDVMNSDTVFIHFIGSLRFVSDRYEKTSRKVIGQMKESALLPSLTS